MFAHACTWCAYSWYFRLQHNEQRLSPIVDAPVSHHRTVNPWLTATLPARAMPLLVQQLLRLFVRLVYIHNYQNLLEIKWFITLPQWSLNTRNSLLYTTTAINTYTNSWIWYKSLPPPPPPPSHFPQLFLQFVDIHCWYRGLVQYPCCCHWGHLASLSEQPVVK